MNNYTSTAKRFLALLLAIISVFALVPTTALAAADSGDIVNPGETIHVSFSGDNLDYLRLRGVTEELVYTYFNFRDPEGAVTEHPVYCIDPNLIGAKQLIRDYGDLDNISGVPYKVDAKITDTMMERVLTRGFPHIYPSQLGLISNEEGYYATKLALWAYLAGCVVSDISVNPSHVDQAAALRVYNAAVEIFNKATADVAVGAGGIEPELFLTKDGNYTDDGEYYIQNFKILATKTPAWNATLAWGTAPWDSPVPDGTLLFNSDGTDITSTMTVEIPYTNGFIATVTAKFPKNKIDDIMADETLETWKSPTLTATATLSGSNFYIAEYTREGVRRGQRYLIEGDP
jgi:hypothetical protein